MACPTARRTFALSKGGFVTCGIRYHVPGNGYRNTCFPVRGSLRRRLRSPVCSGEMSSSLFSYGRAPDWTGMMGMVTLSSVTSLAPMKCLLRRRIMTLLCSQVSSTKGPLQTMLAASVHLSPCFSTEGR